MPTLKYANKYLTPRAVTQYIKEEKFESTPALSWLFASFFSVWMELADEEQWQVIRRVIDFGILPKQFKLIWSDQMSFV